MKKSAAASLGRRDLLVRTMPACAMACLGLGRVSNLAGAVSGLPCQEVHKFDKPMDREITNKQFAEVMNRGTFQMIKTLRQDLGDGETVRLLKLNSDEIGRQQGKAHAASVADTSFENFVSVFRQMANGDFLTGEVVEDSEKVFEMKITECLSAAVYRDAGFEGDIGHAAVCNMDYSWPPAFNPDFKMERTKTLMQGHDCCNHRYINTADR